MPDDRHDPSSSHEASSDEWRAPPPETVRRAQEIILDVYRRRAERTGSSHRPERVIMSIEDYRTLQSYRALLGDAPEGRVDYLERYRLFDLEILIEQVNEPRVE